MYGKMSRKKGKGKKTKGRDDGVITKYSLENIRFF